MRADVVKMKLKNDYDLVRVSAILNIDENSIGKFENEKNEKLFENGIRILEIVHSDRSVSEHVLM